MLNCIITSPSATKQYEAIENVKLPAFSGEMQILTGHSEVFVLLKKGEVVLRQTGAEKIILQIKKGACYVKDDNVRIIL